MTLVDGMQRALAISDDQYVALQLNRRPFAPLRRTRSINEPCASARVRSPCARLQADLASPMQLKVAAVILVAGQVQLSSLATPEAM